MSPIDIGRKNTVPSTTSESSNTSINPSDSTEEITTVHATDGGGAVAKREQKKLWYVVLVAPRSEKSVCRELQKSNYEAYAATRKEIHVWGRGQKREVEQVLIHGVVFVKIASTQREEIRAFPNVYSYMMDPARRHTSLGGMSFAIIPDEQMRLLKVMLGQNEFDVDFTTRFSVGEYVRIAGFDTYDDLAQIVKLPDTKSTYVGVRVDFLGCAYMQVPAARIIKIK